METLQKGWCFKLLIKSSAPCRLSLMGGGTDISPYCDLYNGMCLSMAINIRQEIELTFDEKDHFGEFEIPKEGNPKFYKTILSQFGIGEREVGLKASFDGEITGGLGSSASAAVALVGAIARARDIKYDKDEIAKVAWNIEVNKLGLFGGKQDQFSAAYGGVNLFEFTDRVETTSFDREFIKPVLPWLMLFHTGKNRKNPKIQEGFKSLTNEQIRYLDDIKELVPETIEAIKNKDMKQLGALLAVSWEYKKMSNRGVSNSEIDGLFIKAKECGATSLKLCGSGGGGYVIMVVPPERQEQFKKDIGLRWVDFSADWQGLDVRIC